MRMLECPTTLEPASFRAARGEVGEEHWSSSNSLLIRILATRTHRVSPGGWQHAKQVHNQDVVFIAQVIGRDSWGRGRHALEFPSNPAASRLTPSPPPLPLPGSLPGMPRPLPAAPLASLQDRVHLRPIPQHSRPLRRQILHPPQNHHPAGSHRQPQRAGHLHPHLR